MIAALVLTVGLSTTSLGNGEAASCRSRFSPPKWSAPVEIGTGGGLGSGRPAPLWTAARVRPGFRFGRVHVAGSAGGGGYRGTWTGTYGGSVGLVAAPLPFDLLSIELAVQAEGGVPNQFPVGLAFSLDLGSVLTLNARSTPGFGRKNGFYELGFGFHPVTILRHALRSSDTTAAERFPADPFLIRTNTSGAVQAAPYAEATIDGEDRPFSRCSVVRQLETLLREQEKSASPDFATLSRRLSALGLDTLDSKINGPVGAVARARVSYQRAHNAPLPLTEAEQVREFVAGLRQGLRLIHGDDLSELREP